MDIKQLQFFLTVCEEKSYNKASAKLYLSRQALRKNIQMIEDEIGSPLFLMQGNQLYLTIEGERLRQDAIRVVDAFEALMANNVHAVWGEGQKINIEIDFTMFPFMADLFMGKLNVFLNDHPELEFGITESSESQIFAGLEKGTCDCGFLVLPRLDYPFLEAYNVVCMVPGKSAVYITREKAGRLFGEFEYERLAGETILFPGTENTLYQTEMMRVLEEKGIQVTLQRVDNVEEIANRVRSGDGVSFCTYPGCRSLSHALTTIHIPMAEDKPGFHLAALMRKDTEKTAVKMLYRYLKQAFATEQ